MRPLAVVALAAALALAGCKQDTTATAPPPAHTLTAAAIGHYCGMNVSEHAGPKGQIILAGRGEPVWFSSARDALSFTMLPEEPKDIRAIYVSDMGEAPSWDDPGVANWIDAKAAYFVVGSRQKGGMGADETVPFADRAQADRFASANGGRVVTFAEVPRDYVLGGGPDATAGIASEAAPGDGAASTPSGHGHAHAH